MCKIKHTAILFMMLAMALTGCGDQRVLEKLGFTQTTAYDLLPNHQLKVTNSIPKTDPKAKTSREVLTTTATTSKEAKIHLSRQTDRLLVSGQMRNSLFSITLAKQGIWDYIDTLIRDPSIPARVKVIIVNGNAGRLLSKDYGQHPRTGQYIDRMLEKEAKAHAIPKTSLFKFTRDYYDDGIDPVAPLIKEGKRNILIDGVALFAKDKYITRIGTDDTMFFSLLYEDFKSGDINFNLGRSKGKPETVMFSYLVNKRKIRIHRDNAGKLHATIEIKIKGTVLEYTGGLHLSRDQDLRSLERKTSEHVNRNTERLIKLMQKHKVDSLGIGRYVRNHLSYAEWKQLDWRETFPQVDVQCLSTIKITNFGKFR